MRLLDKIALGGGKIGKEELHIIQWSKQQRKERKKQMNDFLNFQCFKSVYVSDESTEQKVKEIMELYPELATYRDDLENLFDCPAKELPIIRGVRIRTNKLGGDQLHERVTVMQLPSQVSPEIQKMLMRIAGRLGGFQYHKWGKGDLTDNGRKYWMEYFNEYVKINFNNQPEPAMKLLTQNNKETHKVLELDYNVIKGEMYAGYQICEIMGILLD